MPCPWNHVPKYRKHRISGQAIVTLCGTDFYLGPHGSKTSKAEYDRLIAEWLANDRRLVQTHQFTVTIEELLAAFWQHAERYYLRPDGSPTKELDSYRQAMKPMRALSDGEGFFPLLRCYCLLQVVTFLSSCSFGGGNITPIRTTFNRGVFHYSSGNYQEAIAEFKLDSPVLFFT